MPIQNQIGLQNNGWFPHGIPWAEHTGRGAGDQSQQGTRGYDGQSRETMTILVYESDLPIAIADLLGENFTLQIAGVPTLHRAIPMPHPRFTGFYASRITSIKGIGPVAKSIFNNNVPMTAYKYRQLVIEFAVPPYAVVDDATCDNQFGNPLVNGVATRSEWRRFVSFPYEGSVEVLQREGGIFKWIENGPAGTGVKLGDAFPTPWGIFNAKQTVAVRWHRVPVIGSFATATGLPDNIHNCLGKTNSVALSFLGGTGYPIGTMLLLTARGTPSPSILPPSSQGIAFINNSVLKPNVLFDYDLVFLYFNPPSGSALVPQLLGHNLAPSPGVPGSGSSDNLWYPISSDGTNTPAKFPAPSTDLRQCFVLQA